MQSQEEIRGHIKSILDEEQHGLMLHRFLQEYKKRTGEPLPCRRFGFSRPVLMLKSIPSIVHCFRLRCDYLLQATRPLVKQNPSPACIHNLTDAIQACSVGDHVSPENLPLTTEDKNEERSDTSSELPASVCKSVVDLVCLHSRGISLDNFNILYEMHYGHALCPENHGFLSMSQLLNSLGDHLQFVGSGSEKTVVLSRPVHHSSPQSLGQVHDCNGSPNPQQKTVISQQQRKQIFPTNNCTGKEQSGKKRDRGAKNCKVKKEVEPISVRDEIECGEELKRKLTTLLNKYPGGLWSRFLLSEFQKNYEEELDLQRFGCTTGIQFAEGLKSIFLTSRNNGMGDWLLFDAQMQPSEKKLLLSCQE